MNRTRRPNIMGIVQNPLNFRSASNKAIDAYVTVLYSGFNVVAAQADYDVFGASRSQIGALLTNMDGEQGIPTNTSFLVGKIMFRGSFCAATTVSPAVLAEAKRFMANSVYRVGWQGKSDYGIFPVSMCLGALTAVAVDATNNMVSTGDATINGEIKLPQPLPIEAQWNIKSAWEYLLGKSSAMQQGGGMAAQPVSAALVAAGFQIHVLYEGIWQRRV